MPHAHCSYANCPRTFANFLIPTVNSTKRTKVSSIISVSQTQLSNATNMNRRYHNPPHGRRGVKYLSQSIFEHDNACNRTTLKPKRIQSLPRGRGFFTCVNQPLRILAQHTPETRNRKKTRNIKSSRRETILPVRSYLGLLHKQSRERLIRAALRFFMIPPVITPVASFCLYNIAEQTECITNQVFRARNRKRKCVDENDRKNFGNLDCIK